MSSGSGSRQPPPWLIVLAASAGGVHALRTILAALPRDLPAAILIVLHRPVDYKSQLQEILAMRSPMPVVVAHDRDAIHHGIVYLARPDAHLTITADRRLLHRDGRSVRFTRSSANPLLESAAATFPGRVIAVVLTGGGADATDGVQAVKKSGGVVIAQDEVTSEVWGMPRSAIQTGAVDHVLPLGRIAPVLDAIVHGMPFEDDEPASGHGAA
jgi:two-component system chemotaxis response regulator CheB